MVKKIALIAMFFCSISSIGQTEEPKTPSLEKKKLKTKLIQSPISINGQLSENEWSTADIASDFIMLRPDNGKSIAESKKTEVKILYDNEAIYIGATLNDEDPSKIMKEITQRDNTGSSDFFGVSVNGYNDGQQEFRFFVTAAGVQLDANANSQTGEDFSWDAIWDSEVSMTDKGWTVEIKIPYSALRFSNQNTQTWGIQFFRQVCRDRQMYTWNFVDNNKGALEQQSGILEGIENIKTPTRLFFFPYASTYVFSNKESGTKAELKGGLDIKYGINDAFTLDAILIPDFGQTAFDNQILNLGPFEQQFNENRPFFTEGTDLFNKGGLFYSRRIGGPPSTYPELEDNETLTEPFPNTVNLLNALKVSGRTKGGLGIGVLNAITKETEVTIEKTTITENPDPSLPDIIEITRRNEVVEPLANYNVITFDQRFRKNSSVSIVNTNVIRDGHFRDANVTALVWDLNTKKNTFNLSGDSKYSIVNEPGIAKYKTGISQSLSFAETSGKVRFSITEQHVSKDFDSNDLGINFQTNYTAFYGNANYRTLKSTKSINSFNANFNFTHEFENTTGMVQAHNLNVNAHTTLKSNDGMGMGFNVRAIDTYDFYQAMTPGRFVKQPHYYNGWTYISSNYNRKFAIDFEPYYGSTSEKGRNDYGFNFSPRYRFSNKLLVIGGYNYSKENKDKGCVDFVGDDIIFAQRNVNGSTVSLRGKYAINNKMTINFTARYYWRYVENLKFQKLEQDGTLTDYAYSEPLNRSFSAWNADCSYSWWIAPGSQLNVLYRNNSLNNQYGLQSVDKNLKNNFDSLFGDKSNHSFSVSLRYFLDYNRIKNWI